MLAGSKQRPQASKADTTGVKASRGVNSIWVGRRALAKQKEAEQQSKQSDPFVALVGENEMNEGKVTLKNMETGEQKLITPEELVSELS
jgi:histidyl-tRNA synthetase